MKRKLELMASLCTPLGTNKAETLDVTPLSVLSQDLSVLMISSKLLEEDLLDLVDFCILL